MWRRDLLYKVVIGWLVLVGGIGVFLFSLFSSRSTVDKTHPTVDKTEGQSQLSQRRVPFVTRTVRQEKENSEPILDTNPHVTGLSSLTTDLSKAQSVTASPPTIPSGEDQITTRIKELEVQYEGHKRKFAEMEGTIQELGNLIREHSTEGVRKSIEEMKQFEMQMIEANRNGLEDKAAEIRERIRQATIDFNRYGKNLEDMQRAIGEEQDAIAKQMTAIQAELESLRQKKQGEVSHGQ